MRADIAWVSRDEGDAEGLSSTNGSTDWFDHGAHVVSRFLSELSHRVPESQRRARGLLRELGRAVRETLERGTLCFRPLYGSLYPWIRVGHWTFPGKGGGTPVAGS